MTTYTKTYSGVAGWRRVQKQIKAQNDKIRSLPAPIRKAIKARGEALGVYSQAVIDNADRTTLLALRAAYDELCNKVQQMIEEQ